MSNYQAIVFDIDGTAAPNSLDSVPSERVQASIAAGRNRLHLIAATGRPLHYARPMIQALGLTELCVVSGGSIIYNPVTNSVVKHTVIPSDTALSVIALLRQYPYKIYLEEERLLEDQDPSLKENIEVIIAEEIPDEPLAVIIDSLKAVHGIGLSTAPSWTRVGHALIITHEHATKKHAVTDVLKRLGVPREAAIGIGDGNNDIHLFAAVGHKIAMGNASPELMAAADEIAPTVDEDGLAVIIDRYAK